MLPETFVTSLSPPSTSVTFKIQISSICYLEWHNLGRAGCYSTGLLQPGRSHKANNKNSQCLLSTFRVPEAMLRALQTSSLNILRGIYCNCFTTLSSTPHDFCPYRNTQCPATSACKHSSYRSPRCMLAQHICLVIS